MTLSRAFRPLMFVAVVVAWSLACSGGTEVPSDAPVDAPVDNPDDGDDADDGKTGKLPKLPNHGGARPKDCTLDIAGLEPMLARPDDAKGNIKIRRENNAVIERVLLKDGMSVRVSRYGCAHYGESWEFAPAGNGEARALGVAHLKRFKLKNGKAPGLLESLEKADTIDKNGGFPCGDATCDIHLENDVLTVTYDFAM